MLRYITYTRKKVNDNYYMDPNSQNTFENQTTNSTFYETPYEINWTFIAYVEYPDDTTQDRIDELLQAYTSFNFSFITEEEANELLSELWDVSVKDFVFTDNIPIID